jgi:hypothetical protein
MTVIEKPHQGTPGENQSPRLLFPESLREGCPTRAGLWYPYPVVWDGSLLGRRWSDLRSKL